MAGLGGSSILTCELEAYSTDIGLDINTGWPSVTSQEVRESGPRRTVVIACGPHGMADETRRCVHSLLLEGFQNLEYAEEPFGW